MKKEDVTSILFTLFVGFVAGFYVYFTGFTELADRADDSDQPTAMRMNIVSDTYGSCGERCPSFQVERDGSYRYIYDHPTVSEPVVMEGYLPLSYRSRLKESLTTVDLEEQSVPVTGNDCNAQTDRVYATYRVTYEGEEYLLDSCKTTVDTDSNLWQALRSVWDYLQNRNNPS